MKPGIYISIGGVFSSAFQWLLSFKMVVTGWDRKKSDLFSSYGRLHKKPPSALSLAEPMRLLRGYPSEWIRKHVSSYAKRQAASVLKDLLDHQKRHFLSLKNQQLT